MDEQMLMLLIAAGSGLLYAISGYVKNAGQEGAELDIVRLVVNAGAGFAIGILFWYWGQGLTEEGVIMMIATYAGLLALFENFLKGILAKFGKRVSVI